MDNHQVLVLFHKNNEADDKTLIAPINKVKARKLIDIINKNINTNELARLYLSNLAIYGHKIRIFDIHPEDLYTFSPSLDDNDRLDPLCAGAILIDTFLVNEYIETRNRKNMTVKKEVFHLDDIKDYATKRGFSNGVLICKGEDICNSYCPEYTCKCMYENIPGTVIDTKRRFLELLPITTKVHMNHLDIIYKFFWNLAIEYDRKINLADFRRM